MLGQQILLELYDCPAALLSDLEVIETTMKKAAVEMNATIVKSTFHHFSPLGISGVVVIEESHLTIHTWPEHNYAAIDIFTCGQIEIQKGVDYLIATLNAKSSDVRWLKRGEGIIINNVQKK